MRIFIIATGILLLFLLIGDCISFYIHKRKKWIAQALSIFSRLVFFTVLIRKLTNNEELKYDSEDLYKNTLQSNTWMMLRFWIWKVEKCIENVTYFNYIAETARLHAPEFELYWILFIKQNNSLTANNVKKYKDILKNTGLTHTIKSKNETPLGEKTIH
jgi:hypothetical protein